jgi:hypothetical protein
MKTERIVCSALWLKDFEFQKSLHNSVLKTTHPVNIKTGFVIMGLTGSACIPTLALIIEAGHDPLAHVKEMGFITSEKRFVTRHKAALIAFEAGQIDKKVDELRSFHLN